MRIELIKILLDLSKPPVSGQLHLDRYFHIDLRINSDLDAVRHLHDSSSSEEHVPPNLVLVVRVAEIASREAPVLIVPAEGMLDVVEISGWDDQDLFVWEVDYSCVLADHFQLFPVFVDVAVQLFLQREVRARRLVGLQIRRHFEEIDENVGLALGVAVQL